jgi:hypothetical protein
VPRAHARELVDGDVHHAPRWRVVHRWELHVGTDVHARQRLEQLRRSADVDGGGALEDEVLLHPDRVGTRSLDGQHDARIPLEVAQLPPRTEGSEHHLVAVEPHPHAAHMGGPIRVHRDDVGQMGPFEDLTSGVREGDHAGRVEP